MRGGPHEQASRPGSPHSPEADDTIPGAARPDPWPADEWAGPILVIRLSSLGDVILATGPLRLLKQRRPGLTVDLVTRRAYAEVLQACPSIDHLIVAEEHAQGGTPSPGGRYEIALDWQGGRRGRRAASRFAPGARRIVAPRAALRRRLLVWWGRRLAPPEPFVVRLARTLSGQSLPRESLNPAILADPGRQGRLRTQLGGLAAPPSGWIVMAPGASHPAKAIPAELAAAIEAELLEQGWGVIRLRPPGPVPARPGAPADSGDGARGSGSGFEISRAPAGGPRLSFAGALGDVAALLSLARGFVGSDSGILHLASAVGTPAAGLFGPTAPELGFAPLGRSRAIGVDLPCRPCHIHGGGRCWLGHWRCWRDLAPRDVVAAVRRLIEDE